MPANGIAEAIESVTLGRASIEIVLMDAEAEDLDRKIALPWTPISTRRKREIIQPVGSAEPRSHRGMRTRERDAFLDAYADAVSWMDELIADPLLSIATLAERDGASERSIRMRLSLAFLSPDLVRAALDARLPRGFNRSRLVDLPMLWTEQWRALGLARPENGSATAATALRATRRTQ